MFTTRSTNKLLLLTICLLTTSIVFAQKAQQPNSGHADEFTKKGHSNISIKLSILFIEL